MFTVSCMLSCRLKSPTVYRIILSSVTLADSASYLDVLSVVVCQEFAYPKKINHFPTYRSLFSVYRRLQFSSNFMFSVISAECVFWCNPR